MEADTLHPATAPAEARAQAASLWADRWFNWRNRLLANPLFRRAVAASVFTRPVAKSNAKALFDLVAGFVYSQVLFSCVRLNLFEILSTGPQRVETLASRLGLSESATLRLLAAAASLRLAEQRGERRYGLGVLGATLVGNAALQAMIEHHGTLYADLADPVALLQGQVASSRLGGYWPYAGHERDTLTPEQVAPYTRLMAASQSLVSDEILDAYNLRDHRCLLDIGGGDGTFLTRAAARAPHLQLKLFELPAVAEIGRARLAQAGLASRSQVHHGSFLADPLPQGADLAVLVRVLHDHNDDAVVTLLRAAWNAIEPGGTLLIAEPMAGAPGAESMGDAYFGFYLMAMGSGRPRRPTELHRLMADAGFCGIEMVPTCLAMQTQIVVGRKPGTTEHGGQT